VKLDLTDTQGCLLRGYRLPFARYVFLRFGDVEASRALVARLTTLITNAEVWDTNKIEKTLNIAFTRTGLEALGLPIATISTFPVEFLEGMSQRGNVLGDVGPSAQGNWEAMWRGRVDAWVSINALSAAARDGRCAEVLATVAETGGGAVVGTQDAGVLFVEGAPQPIEHFGYTDGFGQPDFIGGQAKDVAGDGKLGKHGLWDEIETGEFILGHRNEAGELAAAPSPPVLAKNGSFLVYRKLEQDVKAFRDYVADAGARYPGGPEKLMAKFVGRWRDGTPLALSPDRMDPAISGVETRHNDFTFADDPQGLKCPLGSHIRRVNPRDSVGFGGRLATRRRIIRRGLPYGTYVPEGAEVDASERGIIFMAFNASISRQFEFVQQQWINYGNDFHLGEDRDPLAGNNQGEGRFVIPGDLAKDEETFICSRLPSFVTLKGGGYFFYPSMTALRLLASGNVDPR
jgi:Dyp-type peroxidase family